MPRITRLIPLLLAVGTLAACDVNLTNPLDPGAPSGLAYQLEPSGDPAVPLGVLLTWAPPSNGRALTYDVYGRASTSDQWTRRATTTSPSFHDAGVPQLQYYVVALDDAGNELGRTTAITIDERNRLPAPLGLGSVSLNGAVQLFWSGNAVSANPDAFGHYRVYSAPYDVVRGRCSSTWALEGTTVSDAFLAANLRNGVRLCFAVSAVSTDGHESSWSATWSDTPRYDATNVLVAAAQFRADSAAFLFADAAGQRFGIVTSTARTDADFTVQRASDGSLWLAPARAGVSVTAYGSAPVSALTVVDQAPVAGFGTSSIEALPGWAYVFRVQEADGTHYGAVRVTMTTQNYLLVDWSYQSAPGDPELSRGGSVLQLSGD